MRLSILQYGDPILRAKGERIRQLPDNRVRELVQNMIETMHAANGVGLAAPQVGESFQLTVLDVSQVEDRPTTMKLNGASVDPKTVMPLVLVNPQIDLGSETETGLEGCLSFPEITGDIERAKSVTTRAQNLDGEPIEIEATGFLARAIQHEVDHLNGILFIDRMSSAAKTSLSSKLKRLQKETRRGMKHRQRAVAETTL
jgi:peptide deformylase